jgi:F0F1-type ATP synthase assembly protein I
MIIVFSGIGLGYLIDRYVSPFKFPAFLLIFSFGAVFAALYIFIKEVSKK